MVARRTFQRLDNKEAASRTRGILLGATVGAFALLIHSIFDFNTHVPSNALLLTSLLGILAGAHCCHKTYTTPYPHRDENVPRCGILQETHWIIDFAVQDQMAGRKRKNKALPPRVKRIKRPARLQSARHWVPTYNGKNIIRGYKKRYGVDWRCAIKELEMLGVQLDRNRVELLKKTAENQAGARRRKRLEKRRRAEADLRQDLDDTFAFIAGYTSWGFPYGITWEEMDEPPPATGSG